MDRTTKRKKGNLSLKTSHPPLKSKSPRKFFQKNITPTINKIGTINCELIKGILNFGDASPSSLFGNKRTPPQTNTKANKVPILVKSVTSVRLRNKAGIATNNPVIIVAKDG